MDSIPEDEMEKLSIYDSMEVNRLFNNPYAVLNMDVDKMNINNFSF